MRSFHFPLIVACALLSTSFCTLAQTREEKVDRLCRFFGVGEAGDYRVKSTVLQLRTAAKQAADEVIAGLPAATGEKGSIAVAEALASLDRALASVESKPTTELWRSFLVEQMSDEDLDNAVAYFLSPSGGRFMASKTIADSLWSQAIQRQFREAVDPAREALQATLRTFAKP